MMDGPPAKRAGENKNWIVVNGTQTWKADKTYSNEKLWCKHVSDLESVQDQN